jgi:hypothetical protein
MKSKNEIQCVGAAKLGESISKLLNLTILNLNIRYKVSLMEIYVFYLLIIFLLFIDLILKFISGNRIGINGVTKLGEGVSKLKNLTSLNFDI